MITIRETTRGTCQGQQVSPNEPPVLTVIHGSSSQSEGCCCLGGGGRQCSGDDVGLRLHSVSSAPGGAVLSPRYHIHRGPKATEISDSDRRSAAIKGHAGDTVQVGELEFTQTFVVVPRLVALVILGVDFMHANSLVLDFTQTPVRVCDANVGL